MVPQVVGIRPIKDGRVPLRGCVGIQLVIQVRFTEVAAIARIGLVARVVLLIRGDHDELQIQILRKAFCLLELRTRQGG